MENRKSYDSPAIPAILYFTYNYTSIIIGQVCDTAPFLLLLVSTYSTTSAYLLQKRGEKSDYLRPFLLMNLLTFLLVVSKSSAISVSV